MFAPFFPQFLSMLCFVDFSRVLVRICTFHFNPLQRQVTFLEASKFAQESGITFLETSALTGDNVEEVFLMCARDILTRIENGLFPWSFK